MVHGGTELHVNLCTRECQDEILSIGYLVSAVASASCSQPGSKFVLPILS
jgi:hypothetical protein